MLVFGERNLKEQGKVLVSRNLFVKSSGFNVAKDLLLFCYPAGFCPLSSLSILSSEPALARLCILFTLLTN